MFLWIWINVQIQFKKILHLPQPIFNLISQKYPQFFISPETQSIRIDSKSRNSPEFDIFDRLAPTLNLDLAHLTKITYTHTVIHHLSRSNSSTIIALFSREKRVSACVPRWTCSIIPLALKFIQYGRTASLDTFLLLLKTFVHLVPFIVRAAMRCMTRASRTFYAFLLKPTTSTVKGSRERAAKGFWKKASLKDRRRRRRVRRRRLTTDVDPPIEISRGRGRVHRFPLVQLILINPGGKMLALPSPLYLPANSNYRTGPFDFLENNPAIGDSFRRFSTQTDAIKCTLSSDGRLFDL